MYYFDFPEETNKDLPDKDKLKDIEKYFEKHSSFPHIIQRELLKICSRLCNKVSAAEEALKRLNDDMDILKGFRPSKSIKDRVNKVGADDDIKPVATLALKKERKTTAAKTI